MIVYNFFFHPNNNLWVEQSLARDFTIITTPPPYATRIVNSAKKKTLCCPYVPLHENFTLSFVTTNWSGAIGMSWILIDTNQHTIITSQHKLSWDSIPIPMVYSTDANPHLLSCTTQKFFFCYNIYPITNCSSNLAFIRGEHLQQVEDLKYIGRDRGRWCPRNSWCPHLKFLHTL